MTDFTRAASLVRGPQIREYFMSHVEPAIVRNTTHTSLVAYGAREVWHQRKSAFWIVTKELKAFKRAADSKVVALVIPVGSHVHAPPEAFQACSTISRRKMRASQAFVHAIHYGFGGDADSAASLWDPSFTYKVGKLVKPTKGRFSYQPDSCAAGIHFFLNFYDAYTWR